MGQLEEFNQIFRVIGFLGILACLAYLLNRFVSSSQLSKSTNSGKGIKLGETRSLGNKQFLVVAEYDSHKFLLGISPGRIERLAKLDPSNSTGADQI